MKCAGKKFLQSALNKHNNITTIYKPLNPATMNHAVCHATLQNIKLIMYQETIQLSQIKLFLEWIYNTDK